MRGHVTNEMVLYDVLRWVKGGGKTPIFLLIIEAQRRYRLCYTVTKRHIIRTVPGYSFYQIKISSAFYSRKCLILLCFEESCTRTLWLLYSHYGYGMEWYTMKFSAQWRSFFLLENKIYEQIKRLGLRSSSGISFFADTLLVIFL